MLPAVVLKMIVSIQVNFLWGWGFEGRKIVRTSWEKVCKSREGGGLGVVKY